MKIEVVEVVVDEVREGEEEEDGMRKRERKRDRVGRRIKTGSRENYWSKMFDSNDNVCLLPWLLLVLALFSFPYQIHARKHRER